MFQREISANTANILAKHNITLNLGASALPKETTSSDDSADEKQPATESPESVSPVTESVSPVDTDNDVRTNENVCSKEVKEDNLTVEKELPSPVKETPESDQDNKMIDSKKGEFDVDKVVNDYFGIADQVSANNRLDQVNNQSELVI